MSGAWWSVSGSTSGGSSDGEVVYMPGYNKVKQLKQSVWHAIIYMFDRFDAYQPRPQASLSFSVLHTERQEPATWNGLGNTVYFLITVPKNVI